MITNMQSGTNVHEIEDGIYRIKTPVTFSRAPCELFSAAELRDRTTNTQRGG